MKKVLIILLTVLLLLAVVACGNEPAQNPTAPPAPGDIPEIPNGETSIKSISDVEKASIQTMIADLMAFFDELFSGSKAISRDVAPAITASGTLSVIVPDQLNLTVSGGDSGVSLVATATISVNGDTPVDASADINVLAMTGSVTIGATTYVIAPDEDGDPEFTVGGAEPSSAQAKYLLDAALSLLPSLAKGTITFDHFAFTYVDEDVDIDAFINGEIIANLDLDDSDVAGFDEHVTVNGNVRIDLESSTEVNGVSTSFKLKGFVFTVDSFLHTEIDNDTEKVETSEESFTGNLSFDKLELSLTSGDAIRANVLAENADFDIGLSNSETDYYGPEAPDDVEETSIAIEGSVDLSFGLKANDNSLGVVAEIVIDTEDITEREIDDIDINAKAVVINGEYYSPTQFVISIMEIVEMMEAEN